MLFSFKNFTNKIINEHAVYGLDLSDFDSYFSEIEDDLKTLKNFNKEMVHLKELFTDIDINSIRLSKIDDENFYITYNAKINALIFAINEFYHEIEDNNDNIFDKINNDYFNSGVLKFDFSIWIEKERFNKFHFTDYIPSFFKKIGLGKKIILRCIDKFSYCLFTKTDDSIDLKIAIESIRNKETNFFSFEKDGCILIFKDDFEIIKETLTKWIEKEPTYFVLDKDFYKKYKNEIENDDFLNKLYLHFSKKYDKEL